MDVVEDVHFLIGQGDKVAHQLGVQDADDAVVELEELGAVAGVRNVVARSGRSSHMRHERLQAIPMAVALQHVIAKDFVFKDIALVCQRLRVRRRTCGQLCMCVTPVGSS